MAGLSVCFRRLRERLAMIRVRDEGEFRLRLYVAHVGESGRRRRDVMDGDEG